MVVHIRTFETVYGYPWKPEEGIRSPGDRQAVMNCPTSVLGTKLETSGRVTSIFTRLAIFSDPAPLFWISPIEGRSETHYVVEDNLELLIL